MRPLTPIFAENWMLANDDWRNDIIPEVMQFVDQSANVDVGITTCQGYLSLTVWVANPKRLSVPENIVARDD